MIWWMEQTFAVTAVMAAAVWGICRRPRVPAKLRHLLWLAVIVKLLLPPVVAWPWAVGGVDRPDSAAVSANTGAATMMARLQHWLALEDEPAVPGPVTRSVAAESAGAPANLRISSQSNAAAPEVSGAAAPGALSSASSKTAWHFTPGLLRRWLEVTWIAGAAGVFLLQLVRIVRLARRVSAAQPGAAALEQELRQLAWRMKVRLIPTRRVTGFEGPYIWSLVRPVLLWPADLPVNAAARGLIVHELAHVKRRDHWAGWLELFAGVVWWWNPVYWLARRELRANAELCCDAWVVALLPGERRGYADVLLSVCERRNDGRMPTMTLGVRSGQRELAFRLALIMDGGARRNLPAMGWAALLVFAALAMPACSLQGLSGAASDGAAKLPFTLGRATTVITSPLDVDGTPDYIGALNAKYGADVTPENNGFVLWADLAATNENGGDSFPPELKAKILRAAGAKPLPAGAKTWENWETYITSITGDKYIGSTKRSGDIDREMWLAKVELWNETDFPELAAYLKNQDKLLDLAADAAARPKWWMPLVSKDGRSLMGVETLYSGMGDVCNALGARALLRINHGDFAGFLHDVTAMKRFSRHLSGEGALGRVAGVDLDHRANQAIAAGAGSLTAVQYRALSNMLNSLSALGTMADFIDESERWERLGIFTLTAAGKINVLKADEFGIDGMLASVD